MQLRKGHPALLDRREEKEIKVYNLLEQLKIPYEQADHEAASTMEACERVDELMQVTMCKNLFLCNRQQTDFYLLLMPGNKKFKTKPFQTNRLCKIILCRTGFYGKISEHFSRFCQCIGFNE